jgi:hypothetical protein
LVYLHISPNVKEHAPLSAGASVERGVDVETTQEHENKAADRGCVSRLVVPSSFVGDDSVLEKGGDQDHHHGMQYQEAFDLARANLAHQVRAFEVLRNVIHTTIMFGVGAASALLAYSVAKIEEGIWWAGIGGIMFGIYVGGVTLFFVLREYKSVSSPAEGVEPEALMTEAARSRSRDEFFENELRRIQHKINRYQIINGERGNNLNLLVRALVFSPLALLPATILGILVHLAC